MLKTQSRASKPSHLLGPKKVQTNQSKSKSKLSQKFSKRPLQTTIQNKSKKITTTHTIPQSPFSTTSTSIPFSDIDDIYIEPKWLNNQFEINQQYDPNSPTNYHQYRLKVPNLKIITLHTPQSRENEMIPFSRFFDLSQFSIELFGKPNAFPATSEGWENSLAEIGVKKNDDIIIYDTSGHLAAARVWWHCIAGGVDDKKVKILKGGVQNWIENDGAVVDAEEFSKFNKEIKKVNNNDEDYLKLNPKRRDEFLAQNEQVFSVIETQSKLLPTNQIDISLPLLIDTRPVGSYKQGHMPGTINLPYPTMLEPTGAPNSFSLNEQNTNDFFIKKIETIQILKKKQNINNDNLHFIFTCQTAQTASTGFISAYKFFKSGPVVNGVQYSLDNVKLQIFDPSFYVYGNPSFEVPGVENSCKRRFYAMGDSQLDSALAKAVQTSM
jgi:3-mercaptopyruvate sulfurtransferase SseA